MRNATPKLPVNAGATVDVAWIELNPAWIMNSSDTEPVAFWIGTQAPPVVMLDATGSALLGGHGTVAVDTHGVVIGVDTFVHEYHCVWPMWIPTVVSSANGVVPPRVQEGPAPIV